MSFLDSLERTHLRWMSALNVADVRIRGLAIVVVSVLNISVGALCYKIASGPARSWSSCFFRVYSVLLDAPGSDASDDDEIVASVVLNVIYIVGLIVFAVLIGMVGEEVTVQVTLACMPGMSGGARCRALAHHLHCTPVHRACMHRVTPPHAMCMQKS